MPHAELGAEFGRTARHVHRAYVQRSPHELAYNMSACHTNARMAAALLVTPKSQICWRYFLVACVRHFKLHVMSASSESKRIQLLGDLQDDHVPPHNHERAFMARILSIVKKLAQCQWDTCIFMQAKTFMRHQPVAQDIRMGQ